MGTGTINFLKNNFMNENIEELHKLIITIGTSGDISNFNLNNDSDYWDLAKNLLSRSLPAGKENRENFLKGLVILENSLHLGSTTQIRIFMERLDLYNNVELMDWIFANRKNPYVPFGTFHPPLEVQSYSQYLEYEKARLEHREKMISLDNERSRLAKERRTKISEEHIARKKANDENMGTKI